MDSAQLYELSLTVGNSIELQANCDRFLSALATVKQLNYTGVWLKNHLLLDAEAAAAEDADTTAVLAYASPRERFERETIPLSHPVFTRLADCGAYSTAAPDRHFHDAAIERRLNQGAFAIFPLGDLGFLKLYTQYRRDPFSDAEMTELGNLIFKFTISLEGCVAHHRVLREVSLRKRAEAALRHREEYFRSLFENALDLILVLKYDGSIEFASPSVERLLGHYPRDLEKQSLFTFIHPSDTPQFMRTFLAQVGTPGISSPVELRFRHGDESWRTLSVSSNNLLSQPSVAGIIMNCHDVTERNRIQEALHLSEERYTLAVRGANDGIWDWDLATDDIYLSSRWMAMLGHEDDSLTIPPTWWLDRVHPEDRNNFQKAFDEHRLGHSDLLAIEYRMLHSDGGYRWMLTRGVAVRDECGEPTRIAGSQTDVTIRRQQRIELEEARRKALDANRAKGEFLANMSHEIRTPMNGVIGMASLLHETKLDSEQQDFVDTIRVSGDALLTIVNDILDLSKIESGKLEIEDADFKLRDCLESALDLVAPAAADKGLEVAYWMSLEVPEELGGDSTRIRQILVNLLGNAVKFTDAGGALISVHGTPLDSGRLELQFSVKDTGIGIDPERAETLFDPFSQADASTTRKYGGTGLGLAICKRLSKLMGGRIWIDSEPGRGSTFHFTVACNPKPEQDAATDRLQLSGLRLLVVDDNPTVRSALALQAVNWGAETCAAPSGTEALSILGQDSVFDAALIDLDMPEMNGVVLARAIHGLPQGRNLPIILLTPVGADRSLVREAREIVDATVPKPIRPGRLYDALASQLESVQPRHEGVQEVLEIESESMPQLRILLAEDNPVNQKVALLMLDRLGYRPDVAGDGIEVMAALEKKHYDLILMDVQMPNMDGLEATRQIRARGDLSDVKIIAMTAHALEGDRERCLEAGMDGYLTKPVQMADLRTTFIEAAPVRFAPPASEPAREPQQSADSLLDPERIEQLRAFALDGQAGILAALVETFVEATPGQLESVREAAAARDGEALKRAAHQLKGGALNLGAAAVVTTCKALETAGQREDFEEVDTMVERLATELAEAQEALEALAAADR